MSEIEVLPSVEVIELGMTSVEVVELGTAVLNLTINNPSGGGVSYNFAYGDATPAVVYTVPSNSLLVSAALLIRVPFNGAGAALQLGTIALPGLYLPSGANDPTLAAEFETYPNLTLAAGSQIFLSITPGTGATQGQGSLRLVLLPL